MKLWVHNYSIEVQKIEDQIWKPKSMFWIRFKKENLITVFIHNNLLYIVNLNNLKNVIK
jgi:hypothetical protein